MTANVEMQDLTPRARTARALLPCIRGILSPPWRLRTSMARPFGRSIRPRRSRDYLLVRVLKRPGWGARSRFRSAAPAEAWLLQDDIRQATEAPGRPPEARERLDPARLSDLWRMHGRLAAARGEARLGALPSSPKRVRPPNARARPREPSAFALRIGPVLSAGRRHRHCPRALDAGGLALHAVGDRRHLAMVHSLSGVTLAQEGRLDEGWRRSARRSVWRCSSRPETCWRPSAATRRTSR